MAPLPPRFDTMTTEAIDEWVAATVARWDHLGAALAALADRGVSYREISRRHGIPRTTVATKAARAATQAP